MSMGRATCPLLWAAAEGSARPCGVSLTTNSSEFGANSNLGDFLQIRTCIPRGKVLTAFNHCKLSSIGRIAYGAR